MVSLREISWEIYLTMGNEPLTGGRGDRSGLVVSEKEFEREAI